mmetsp:Transcript_52955/g.133284  ORF Transcript_52955/g.133284 Transcript_52955/m.133284 type:complete len:82 (-) Transcript_52955:227-472(-)
MSVRKQPTSQPTNQPRRRGDINQPSSQAKRQSVDRIFDIYTHTHTETHRHNKGASTSSFFVVGQTDRQTDGEVESEWVPPI